MIDKLLEMDRDLFLFLNGQHLESLDHPVFLLTHTLTWTPLFLILLYFIIKEHGAKTWIFLIGLGIAIALSDQITSSIMKPLFARWRPSRDPALAGIVHTVKNYVGGKYGFASSHAANTFATATFAFLLLRRTRPWVVLMFLWAAFVCYTRIYLGVHYPGDLLVGGLIGASLGYLMLKLCLLVEKKIYQSGDTRSGASTPDF